MRRTRSRIFQALSAVAAALALACSFGGGVLAASDASMHFAAPEQQATFSAVLRWHKLTLQNGWVSSQQAYDSGDPAVAIQRGIVYLSGSMHQASGTSGNFARLPRGFRPAHVLYLHVYTFAGAEGSMAIAPNGQMLVGAGRATGYTSLAGISFPVSSVRMHTLHLLNGWASARQIVGGDPQAGVQGGIEYLAGSMHQASGTSADFARLPRGLRPSRDMVLTDFTDLGAPGAAEILTNGQMAAFGTTARSFTALDGLSFPATTAGFQQLSLVKGWAPNGSALGGPPVVGIRNGVVYFAGGVEQLSGQGGQIATLPHACWPVHNLWLPLFTAGGQVGGVEIAKNGEMFVFGGDAAGYSGLAGISYPVSS